VSKKKSSKDQIGTAAVSTSQVCLLKRP